MNVCDTMKQLNSERTDAFMHELYGNGAAENKARYEAVLKGFKEAFGDSEEVLLFSSPGRTEISGNHTDHNHGKVLAGSINLDCVGAAAKNYSNQVHIISETYDQNITIDLNDLEPSIKKAGTVDLIKGLLKGFETSGYSVGGFNAYITSNVISAAGVSSSASFEMLVCSMLNTFFNESHMDNVAYAHIGKYAENVYWDKASGLLDQMACAVGGLITIDFVEPMTPVVKKIDFDFQAQNHSLIIVQTGKGHADLSQEYSEIPGEMKAVAKVLGVELLHETNVDALLEHCNEIEDDRAVLRALHFFGETSRVEDAADAIHHNDYDKFLELIDESGKSSWELLQNCYTMKDFHEQKITRTLALTQLFLKKIGAGVCRVHGGGFAGVIAAIVPEKEQDNYVEYISRFVGKENVYPMDIRAIGAVHIG